MGEIYSISAGEQVVDQQIGNSVREHENIKDTSVGGLGGGDKGGNTDPSTSEKADGHNPLAVPLNSRHVEMGREKRDRVYALIGGSITLVACHANSKAAVFKSHLKVIHDQMEDDEYLAVLGRANRNIAVLLGNESGGLVSLDFDTDEHAETFLAKNPRFANTLQTKGARGCNYWVFIVGKLPKSFTIRDDSKKSIVEFRGNKRITVILGSHPDGVRYQVLNNARPIHLSYPEIVWPEEWVPKITAALGGGELYDVSNGGEVSREYEALVKKYGEPICVGSKGKIAINQTGLAGKFLIENPVVYRVGIGFFEYAHSEGIWKPRSIEWVKNKVVHSVFEFLDTLDIADSKCLFGDRIFTEIVNLVRSLGEVDFTEKSNAVIHMGNGMLNLNVTPPELFPFSPDYYSVNRIPFNYDPGADYPRFRAFLYAALEPEDVLLVQKWAGMALCGENFAQAILLLTGVAGAGKGVLADILTRIIGLENCEQLRTSHLDKRFEIARYIDKTVLVAPDVRGDFLNLTGAQTLKSLSGGDFLTAELKGTNGGVRLKGIFNIIITSNRRLRVSLDGDHDAWKRRLKVVKFTEVVEKKVPDFARQIIHSEASGILNWMIEGLRKLRADFAVHGKWCLAGDQEKRIDDLLLESNSVLAFVREELEVGTSTSSVTSHEMYLAYERFCSDRGWSPLPKHTVTTELPEFIEDQFRIHPRHDIQRAGVHQRGWGGIKLKHLLNEGYAEDAF